MKLIDRLFRKSTDVPAASYTLINTSRGTSPAVVVVNAALTTGHWRARFPWHLQILIPCHFLAENGMPTPGENQVLYELEDQLATDLRMQDNAVFVSRVTCDGRRELSYHVHDPKIANEALSRLVALQDPLRQWEYTMVNDPEGDRTRSEFLLLEKATSKP